MNFHRLMRKQGWKKKLNGQSTSHWGQEQHSNVSTGHCLDQLWSQSFSSSWLSKFRLPKKLTCLLRGGNAGLPLQRVALEKSPASLGLQEGKYLSMQMRVWGVALERECSGKHSYTGTRTVMPFPSNFVNHFVQGNLCVSVCGESGERDPSRPPQAVWFMRHGHQWGVPVDTQFLFRLCTGWPPGRPFYESCCCKELVKRFQSRSFLILVPTCNLHMN